MSQKPSYEADLAEIKRATANLPKSIVNVNLTGGEPFLVKNITETALYYLSHSHIYSVYITTNGFYTERIREFVRQTRGIRPDQKIYLSLSLDGPAEVHDRIRQVKGLFDRALESYQLLASLDEKHIEAHISITVTQDNYQYCLDFYEWLREQGVKNIGLTLERSQGVHAAQSDLYQRVLQTYEELSKRLAKHEASNKKSFFAFCLGIKNRLMHELVLASAKGQKEVMPCSAGRDFFILDSNLEVRNCEPQGRVMGSLRQQTLGEILSNQENLDYFQKNNVIEKCDCSYECAKTVNIMTNPRYLKRTLAYALKAKLGL